MAEDKNELNDNMHFANCESNIQKKFWWRQLLKSSNIYGIRSQRLELIIDRGFIYTFFREDQN